MVKILVNIAKNFLIMLNNLQQTDTLKTTSQRVIQETAETTGNLIDNKITGGITKVSKSWQQNNSETVTNEHDKEISKERYIYISLEKRQETIDDLRLIYYCSNGISKK